MPEVTNPLILSHQLCFALYATSRAITKFYASLLDEMNLTYPQYLTLLVLWERDGISVQQIADELELEGATATPLIQRMERMGLVKRQRSNEDGRQLEVHLTERGMALREKALGVPHKLGGALGITKEDAERLVSDLNALRERIS